MRNPALDAARAQTIAKLQASTAGTKITVRCDRHGPHAHHKGELVGPTDNQYVWRVLFGDGAEEEHHVDGIDL